MKKILLVIFCFTIYFYSTAREKQDTDIISSGDAVSKLKYISIVYAINGVTAINSIEKCDKDMLKQMYINSIFIALIGYFRECDYLPKNQFNMQKFIDLLYVLNNNHSYLRKNIANSDGLYILSLIMPPNYIDTIKKIHNLVGFEEFPSESYLCTVGKQIDELSDILSSNMKTFTFEGEEYLLGYMIENSIDEINLLFNGSFEDGKQLILTNAMESLVIAAQYQLLLDPTLDSFDECVQNDLFVDFIKNDYGKLSLKTKTHLQQYPIVIDWLEKWNYKINIESKSKIDTP